jgi:uncharacterized protein with von Willebrand factor type A (vWA) domain
LRTRRFAPAPRGEKLDVRRMLRQAASRDEILLPLFAARKFRAPPLVVLCDISGSMDIYARIFLHFLYSLTNAGERVHAFLFGTRLTNVTRLLQNRDPDAALAKVGRQVQDWQGGTRIGFCLSAFNRDWARRVLGQNATVLLITDGLDRAGGADVGAAARRLSASARRLIWLNPLLRYVAYEPLSAGARDLARYASAMLPCHNLQTLAGLAASLSGNQRTL